MFTWAYYENRGLTYTEYQRRCLQDVWRRFRYARKHQKSMHMNDAWSSNKERRERGQEAYYFRVLTDDFR